ncbi:MAG: hypothetical protein WA876_02730 [Candidatus Acidiferrales bacterium]
MAPMLNGVVEIDEDGPEDGETEEKREDFAGAAVLKRHTPSGP